MGEPERSAAPEATPGPAAPAAAAGPEPDGLLTAAVLRGLLLCVAGWMFAGMALWTLVLDPRPNGAPESWGGWSGRDVLLTLAAAYCLRGMAQYVWTIVLYQRELRGRPPVSRLARNLGSVCWQVLACVAAVGAFALAPYRLGAGALGLVPASAGWLAAGAAVGLLGGPGGLLAVALLCRLARDPLRFEGRQVDFFAPPEDGRPRPPAAVAGMLVLVLVLGPFAEELLFRGVVYAGLRNELGTWPAVLLSALVFGLAHLEFGRAAAAFTAVMGVAFALLVEGSGSLWPAVLAHVLVNSKMIVAYAQRPRDPVAPEAGGPAGA
jgi:membrane protease YdiL (CAAX protease family)